MEKQIAFVLLILGFTNALTVNKTSCPEVRTVDHFSLNSFSQGIWYSYGRYPNEIESNQETLAYKGRHTRQNFYKFRLLDVADSSPEYIETEISLDKNFKASGDILATVAYGKPKIRKNFKVRVPLFDPKNYAIVYSCKFDETEKVVNEYASVLVRSKKPSLQIKTKLDEFIEKSKFLEYDNFEWINAPHSNTKNKQ